MADLRETHIVGEILTSNTADLRNTHIVGEILTSNTADLRSTQLVTEVLCSDSVPPSVVAFNVEVLWKPGEALPNENAFYMTEIIGLTDALSDSDIALFSSTLLTKYGLD